MESIGCKIKKCSNNIFISHPYNNSIDFNFVAVYSNDFLPSSKCYRISNKTNSQLTKIEILKNYIPSIVLILILSLMEQKFKCRFSVF